MYISTRAPSAVFHSFGPWKESVHKQWNAKGMACFRCSCATGPAATSDASRITTEDRSSLPSYLQCTEQTGTVTVCAIHLMLRDNANQHATAVSWERLPASKHGQTCMCDDTQGAIESRDHEESLTLG